MFNVGHLVARMTLNARNFQYEIEKSKQKLTGLERDEFRQFVQFIKLLLIQQLI